MTLHEMLLHAGLTPAEARRINRHICKLSGAQRYRYRSTPALVLQGKDFQLMTLIKSRVEEDEGKYFTIKNITL